MGLGSDGVLEDMSVASRIFKDIFKVVATVSSPWPCAETSSKFSRAYYKIKNTIGHIEYNYYIILYSM